MAAHGGIKIAWAGTYLDTILAASFGETNTDSWNAETGEYEPFSTAARQSADLVTNGAAWLSFLGMGAGFKGQRMDAEYFKALADAAKVKIEQGADPNSIDASIDPGMELGELVGLGAAWQNRLETARHDKEQQLGRTLTEAEEKDLRRAYSPNNRQFSKTRNATLFRFARGEIGVDSVLEEVVEDSIDRDMARTGRGVAFYVDSIRQMEKELGKEGAFLADKPSFTKQDIIEAVGKMVRGKVLADTAKPNNGLSDWVNDFLSLVRKWVNEVVAMVRLGDAVNKVLSDPKARERLGDEFVNMVEDLAHQNTEFMRGLQRDATLRYTMEAATRKPNPTPTLTAAMEKHGAQVRKETEEREQRHKALSDDIAAANAIMDGEEPAAPQEPATPAETKQEPAHPVDELTQDEETRAWGKAIYNKARSDRGRRKALDMVRLAPQLKESGVDVTTEAGAQKAADMAEYAARCREQLEARAQKPLDDETQARVLATLMGWERWHELGELVDEAAAWDGKKRVTPKLIEAPKEGTDFSASVKIPAVDVCHTREEARAKAGRKGKPLTLGNSFLNLTAVFNAKSEGKFSDKDSIGRTIAFLEEEGYDKETAKTAHYTAYGNVSELFAKAERMKFERAYKKKAERKGFLHVYSPFEIEGLAGDFEANIELEIHQEEGKQPTAYLLNVSIQKRRRAIERSVSDDIDSAVLAAEMIKSDFPELVKNKARESNANFSSALRFSDSATSGHSALSAGRMAFAQTIAENVSKMLAEEVARFRNYDGKVQGSREKALVAIGAVYNMARSVSMLMPAGYRVNVHPYMKQLQVFAELAATGDLDLTADIASQKVRDLDEMQGRMADWQGSVEALVQEYGNAKVNEVLAKILTKVGEKLTKMERDVAVDAIQNLFERLAPKKDPKTGKLKRGVMQAEGYEEMEKVAEAMKLDAEALDKKLAEIEAGIAKAEQNEEEAEILRLQGEHILFSTYGNLAGMNLAQVMEAYRSLQERVRWNRWAWDEVLSPITPPFSAAYPSMQLDTTPPLPHNQPQH